MVSTYDPIASLNEQVKGMTVAMLTTVYPDSTLHSCPMVAQSADADGVIWFLSSSKTDKVEALHTSQRMNIAFSDPVGQRYVSVSGYCELVRDHVKSKELWKAEYKSWLPGGLDDPNLILLKVNVQQAEYWDPSRGGMVELRGFANSALG
jgi:general stress protein 26